MTSQTSEGPRTSRAQRGRPLGVGVPAKLQLLKLWCHVDGPMASSQNSQKQVRVPVGLWPALEVAFHIMVEEGTAASVGEGS